MAARLKLDFFGTKTSDEASSLSSSATPSPGPNDRRSPDFFLGLLVPGTVMVRRFTTEGLSGRNVSYLSVKK